MSFFDDILGRVGSAAGGAAAGSALGPIGAIGGGILGAIGGGGGGGGSSAGGQTAGGLPLDFYAQYAAQAAAANTPITLANARFGSALGMQEGALGLYAGDQSAAGRKLLDSAIARAQLADGSRAGELLEATRGKFDNQQEATKGQFGLADKALQGRVALDLLAPNTAAQAAGKAIDGDIALQKSISDTNLGLKALQESAKVNIAQQYAQNLGTAFLTRAATEGRLAEGSQRIAGQLAVMDSAIVGDLTRNKAVTESDIARTRAGAAATKDLRQNAVGIAMAGNRYFT